MKLQYQNKGSDIIDSIAKKRYLSQPTPQKVSITYFFFFLFLFVLIIQSKKEENYSMASKAPSSAIHVVNFITGNKNKLSEVKAILEPTIEVRSEAIDVIEVQGSLEEVTIAKCKSAAEQVSLQNNYHTLTSIFTHSLTLSLTFAFPLLHTILPPPTDGLA